MILLEDTRNPVSKHRNVHQYCDASGIQIVRSKMLVGDYTLPANQSVCIDTKADLQEVYSNLTQQHDRFRAECLLAKESEIRLIVLVEQSGVSCLNDVTHWQNPRAVHWHYIHNAQLHGKMLNVKQTGTPPMPSDRLCVIMQTMSDRYGIEWMFCSKEETGKRVIELLGGAK